LHTPLQQSPFLEHELPSGKQADNFVKGVARARGEPSARLLVVAKAGTDVVMKNNKAATEVSLVMFPPFRAVRCDTFAANDRRCGLTGHRKTVATIVSFSRSA
jgi:hypothetical protein